MTKRNWMKTSDRSGENGSVYESSDGLVIEQILEAHDIGITSSRYRYTVSHYVLSGPDFDEIEFSTLAEAKRYIVCS
jgi:hypothetical protein